MDIGVLTVVTAGLAVFAVLASARMLAGRHAADGQAWRAWSAAVLVALALVAWFFEAGHHQRQQLATEAMRAFTDNPRAEANCQRLTSELFDLSQYDGYVYWDNSNVALYKRHICKDLAAYTSGAHDDPSQAQVAAVHLIAHESMHVMGLRNEAETECHAVQRSHEVAEFLGATPEQARELQATYFESVYPQLRNDYRSSQCREGGTFDIHPDRTAFP
jgi:hypothetical protein